MIKVSAPGKLMLLGEHAVLNGHSCLVAAINKRIFVETAFNNKKKVNIFSEEFGEYSIGICDVLKTQNFETNKNFKFVLSAVKTILSSEQGVDIKISSEFPSNFGLGSSAALTVATVHSLSVLFNLSLSKQQVFQKSYKSVFNAQGKLGSGFDIAASTFGGILLYSKQKGVIKQFTNLDFIINAVYSGYKIPTPEVIKIIQTKENVAPEKYKLIYNRIGDLVDKGIECLKQKNWENFGKVLNDNQVLLEQLGASDSTLDYIVQKLQSDPNIYGAKLSGSGLGDCAIGIGKQNLNKLQNFQVLNLKIDTQGVQRC